MHKHLMGRLCQIWGFKFRYDGRGKTTGRRWEVMLNDEIQFSFFAEECPHLPEFRAYIKEVDYA